MSCTPAALPRPRAVCFDAFNTLVALGDPPGHLVRLLAGHGLTVPLRLAEQAWHEEMRVYRRLCHTAGDEAGLEAVRRAAARALVSTLEQEVPIGLPEPVCVQVLLDSLDFQVIPGVSDCLRTLQRLGVRLAVVSNWDCSLPPLLERLGLAPFFDAVVVSAVLGVEKPDPRMWQPALEALGVAPHEAWHVGDEPDADVAGARAAGLTPVLVGGTPPGGQGDGVLSVTSVADLPKLLTAGEAADGVA